MTRRSPTGIIICKSCGVAAPRHGNTQLYCDPCSEKRDLERKRIWALERTSPETRERANRNSAEARVLTKEAGQDRSTGQSICWLTSEPSLFWFVRVAVPFTYATSKNHVWATTRRGHVYKRQESNKARHDIGILIKDALDGRRVANNKLWIDILVQKPNHKGDAVNVVDLVCDAIKDVIPVDDRWYSIRRLDWEVVKKDPMLYVGIGQESDEDVQVCSACGGVLPLHAFTSNKHNKLLGVSRTCRECDAAGRRLAKQRRAAESGP